MAYTGNVAGTHTSNFATAERARDRRNRLVAEGKMDPFQAAQSSYAGPGWDAFFGSLREMGEAADAAGMRFKVGAIGHEGLGMPARQARVGSLAAGGEWNPLEQQAIKDALRARMASEAGDEQQIRKAEQKAYTDQQQANILGSLRGGYDEHLIGQAFAMPEERSIVQRIPAVTPASAGAGPTAALNPAEEVQFRKWYSDMAQRHDLNPDPDSADQLYDYRSAFKAGAKPDAGGHWPSMFKRAGHPNEIVGGFNTRTGERAPGTERASEEDLINLGWDPATAKRLAASAEPSRSDTIRIRPAAQLSDRDRQLRMAPPHLRPALLKQYAEMDAKAQTADAAMVKARADEKIAQAQLKRAEGGDTTSALVAVMGPDGRPVLVPRSQAIGMQPASSREQGRQVTSGDVGRISDLNTSLDDLAVLRSTLTETKDATGTSAAIGAAMPAVVTDLIGWGTDAKKRQGVIDRVKQVIGKALEGGVLRKEDEIKYEKILPTIRDTAAVAESKLSGLESALKQRRQTFIDDLERANYDTSGFTASPRGGGGAQGGPKPGERRMINGQMGEWDGTGWRAVQ